MTRFALLPDNTKKNRSWSNPACGCRTGSSPLADSSGVNSSPLFFPGVFLPMRCPPAGRHETRTALGPDPWRLAQTGRGNFFWHEWRQRQEKRGLSLTTFFSDMMPSCRTTQNKNTELVSDYAARFNNDSVKPSCGRHESRGQRLLPQGCPY